MIMKVLLFIILLITLQSCTTKKYTKTRLLPEGIKSATEEIYVVVNNQKKLLQKKKMVYTNKELSKIVTKDKNDILIDEVLISCETKDEKGTCIKEIRISTKKNHKE